jgi:hypothetical protein
MNTPASEAPTPQEPHDVRAFGSDVAGLSTEERQVRAETLVSVLMSRVQQLESRQVRTDGAVARVEARVSVVEGKLDRLLERVGHVPTKAMSLGGMSVATALVVIAQWLMQVLGR